MQESVQAALTYIRARAEQFGLPNDFYKKISSYGLFEENLARGLVATGVIFH